MDYIATVVEMMDNIWVKNQPQVIEELFDPLAIIDSPIRLTIGHQGKLDIIHSWHKGFSNITSKLHDVLCEDAKVFVNWTCHATHAGEFLNIPATGRRIIYNGFSLFHFVNNKIQRYQAMVNLCPIYEQMGIDFKTIIKPIVRGNSSKLIQEINKIKGLAHLNIQEIQCISLWINHRSDQEICSILNLSLQVLETIGNNIEAKLGVQSYSGLNDYFKQSGAAHLLHHYGEYLLHEKSKQIA